MSRASISTTLEVLGRVDSAQQALRAMEADTKRVATIINKTKAELKVAVDTRTMETRAKEGLASIDRLLAKGRQLLVKVKVDDTDLKKVDAKIKETTKQQFIRKFGTSSGTDPLLNAIGTLGPQAAGALAIAKVGEAGLNVGTTYSDMFRARGRGDIEAELAAQERLRGQLGSVPLVGSLGTAIHGLGSSLSGETDALLKVQQETREQEKINDILAQRAARQRTLNEQQDGMLRMLQRESDMRNAPPSRRGVVAAQAILNEELRRQERMSPAELNLKTRSGQDAKAIRDELGANLSGARTRSRSGERAQKVRETLDRQVEAEERGNALRETIERRRRNERNRRVTQYLHKQVMDDEERELREERGRQLAQGRSRTRNWKVRRANAIRVAQDEGEGATRILELQGEGRSGAARVAEIEEGMKRAIEAAGGDATLEDQAKRRAAAELRILERELQGGRAEVVSDAAFKDLSGKFAGSRDPSKETAEILKGDIRTLLRQISTNTRDNTARTS